MARNTDYLEAEEMALAFLLKLRDLGFTQSHVYDALTRAANAVYQTGAVLPEEPIYDPAFHQS